LRADIDITETTVVKNIERRARKVQSSAEIAQSARSRPTATRRSAR
jgi:hypothetical protein